MRKVIGLGLSAAAVIATGLIPTAAGAAVTATDPSVNTTVTFAVTIGALSITAPDSVALGTTPGAPGAPGTTISGPLGTVTVTDTRAALAATWTATAKSTDFNLGPGHTSPAETIPAGDVSYTPGVLTVTTGTITPTGTTVTALSDAPQTVVTATGVGNNTVSWDPTLAVAVPAAAVGGTYTGTLTQSVT